MDTKSYKIIKQFNKQIKTELKAFKKEKECPSYFKKHIFILSKKIDLIDWRIIRDDLYFHQRDRFFDEKDRDKFIYKKLNEYVNKNM